MEINYLINIVKDLENRFKNPKLPYEHELKIELINLSGFEREIIKNKINSMKFDIGALNVIKILHECKVTSMSEYLKNIKTEDEKLQLITEILDCKEHIDLFEELITSNLFNDLIDLSIKYYVNDLIHDQNIEHEIITSMQSLLPAETFKKSILSTFLKHLYHMDFKSPSELIDVFSNQKDYNLEFESFKNLRMVFENIMPLHNDLIVKEICNLIQNDKNICWFFILMTVGYIKDEYEGFMELKNLINAHVNTFIDTQNTTSLQKSLILSRQLFHYTTNKQKLSYLQWLKTNIGDLNYKLKNKSLFSFIMENLTNLVSFENDLDIIETAISVQISAPSKEYSKVVEYKQILKSRRHALEEEFKKLSQIYALQ